MPENDSSLNSPGSAKFGEVFTNLGGNDGGRDGRRTSPRLGANADATGTNLKMSVSITGVRPQTLPVIEPSENRNESDSPAKSC
jgi:hypothetical protein